MALGTEVTRKSSAWPARSLAKPRPVQEGAPPGTARRSTTATCWRRAVGLPVSDSPAPRPRPQAEALLEARGPAPSPHRAPGPLPLASCPHACPYLAPRVLSLPGEVVQEGSEVARLHLVTTAPHHVGAAVALTGGLAAPAEHRL